jgi:beta-lactam-binding protein with PASTA domain
VGFAKQTLQALGKVGIVLAIGAAFLSGLAGTVYLSLRSAEVKVPDIIGKDRLAAEAALSDAGLHLRQRGTRYSADVQPNTILDQMPKAGEVIKVGQTVAIVLSRAAAKEGESSMPLNTAENKPEAEKPPEGENANKPAATANNQNENQNQNQNKEKRTRNKNTNNSNNSNNGNASNRNANNANNRNVTTNTTTTTTTTNADNRNVNTNSNRSPDNSNTNKRAPVNISTPPFNPSGSTP